MSAPLARGGRAVGATLAVLGLVVGAEATTFDVYFLTDPVGPKALPLLSAFIFLGSGIFLMARPGVPPSWAPTPVLKRMAAAVLAFAAYALLLAPLGFVAATTVTVASLSLLFGGPRNRSIASALVLSVILWYLFVWVLGLPLPLGAVWEALWMP